ncbi:MAG: hypothetical protein ACFCUR_07400 [Rhodomicrobiaceae bacterium]
MSEEGRRELQRLAEEAIYSAKGHFKTADWIGMAVAAYVTVPLLTSLIIFIFDPAETFEKILALLGAAFSVLALSSAWSNRSDKSERAMKSHMNLGNKYLEVYKEMRAHWAGNEATPEAVSDFRQRLSTLDNQTCKLRIRLVGRYWAKFTIKSEVDLAWLLDVSGGLAQRRM